MIVPRCASHRKNSVEDIIPDFARDTKTQLKVLVVMRKVVLLDLLQEGWETFMVHPER